MRAIPMPKHLVVREYDPIKESQEPGLDEKDFNALKSFLENPRNFGSDEERLSDFMECRNGVIKIKNYVGVIELPSGTQIEILPKINFSANDDWGPEAQEKSRAIFLKMLSCLRNHRFKISNFANLNKCRLPLFEIFIKMYADEVDSLVKKGLKSSYVPEEDNLRFFKGKLMVSQHIKYNAAHKERFYMCYDEYQLNRPENKLIKSTLLFLQKKSCDGRNQKLIRQLLNHFELVDRSWNYDSDFSRVESSRNMRDYGSLMDWSKVFLKNWSFSTFNGNNKTKALLFPMEKVFEDYVATTLKKNNDSWSVTTQGRQFSLFYTNAEKDDSGVFNMRPDIVLQKDSCTIISDTKWKSLENRSPKYGISQGDMYQMFAYAHKYKTPDIVMLYPLNDAMRDYAPGAAKKIEYFGDRDDLVGPEGGVKKRIHIRVFFVNMETILNAGPSDEPAWVRDFWNSNSALLS